MKPVVAIVGRPNVGKSTIFNRFVGERKSIVDDFPGVTRDRLYDEANWQKHNFIVIDTGGIQWEKEDISLSITKQAEIAITEADVILMVVDNTIGITSDDQKIANILKKTNKPVVLTVNKTDNFNKSNAYEFYSLGLGEPIPISAVHGANMGDLLDEITSHFFEIDKNEDDDPSLKVAIIGRPNVGKSSLVNKLSNEDRVIVSNISGTTRDAVDQKIMYFNKPYTFIDTAGIRRKSKVGDPIERYTIIRSLKAIERSDITLLLIDALEGVTEQDKKVAGFAFEKGKGIIIVVNKWDLVTKDSKTMKAFEEDIRDELKFLSYAPIVFISALSGKRIYDLFPLIDEVNENCNRKIETSLLNQLIREIVSYNPPSKDKGKNLKIYYVTQIKIKPPSFALFVNDDNLVHFSYKRYIENKFREAFSFKGTPIRLFFQNKKGEK